MQCIFSTILKKLYIRRPITIENSILSSLLIPFCGTCMNWSPRHYPCDCSYLCLGYFDIFFITGRSIFTYCGCTSCTVVPFFLLYRGAICVSCILFSANPSKWIGTKSQRKNRTKKEQDGSGVSGEDFCVLGGWTERLNWQLLNTVTLKIWL